MHLKLHDGKPDNRYVFCVQTGESIYWYEDAEVPAWIPEKRRDHVTFSQTPFYFLPSLLPWDNSR